MRKQNANSDAMARDAARGDSTAPVEKAPPAATTITTGATEVNPTESTAKPPADRAQTPTPQPFVIAFHGVRELSRDWIAIDVVPDQCAPQRDAAVPRLPWFRNSRMRLGNHLFHTSGPLRRS